ncbi:hypothetical protein EJ05DRAFT_501806 [Pseudovirgaria hyperparasitica]|uniref:Uncharacterized protein n=1 Tax=Pseudovirgaria hyperparasitica TaxID=470096 RepID=A0A6A6W056_9PEZI|nr:uncharacterized protein EJ05DRAFT_501806 [Pseudovirgaria hyperparasitica]KAF2756308.1 hypothetical protein EJ05DRAFT_501806 [Pseudovirgaria hyperparasitica]
MASTAAVDHVLHPTTPTNILLPRVVIKFCTQCRWMLRAAYFGQELLSTFGTTIGEVVLQPTMGGLFRIELTYDLNHPAAITSSNDTRSIDTKYIDIKHVLLWDRKTEGGFPETKVLKQRVRDHIEPSRHLGHSEKGEKTSHADMVKHEASSDPSHEAEKQKACEDCK